MTKPFYTGMRSGDKIKNRFLTLILAIGLAASNAAESLPSEGFEPYALLGKTSKKGSATFHLNGGYVNPAWIADYTTASAYVSFMGTNSNVLTLGALSSLNGNVYSRSAYFARYDLTFLGQSFAVKAGHVDYHYLSAGKNTLSLTYNAGGNASDWSQIYFLFGAYYRFSLNRWNEPAWSPINFNTEDREWFFEMILGLKILFSADQYLTLDVNNRDPFYNYNGDFFAIDVSYNVLTSKSLTWRLSSSSRISSWLSGTGQVSEQTVQFGFISQF